MKYPNSSVNTLNFKFYLYPDNYGFALK